jgi:hypothetical protein
MYDYILPFTGLRLVRVLLQRKLRGRWSEAWPAIVRLIDIGIQS